MNNENIPNGLLVCFNWKIETYRTVCGGTAKLSTMLAHSHTDTPNIYFVVFANLFINEFIDSPHARLIGKVHCSADK